MFNLKKKNFITFSIIFLFFASMPVYAYAGPGAAIGIIVIFFTVIFAFFSSVLISIFEFAYKNLKKLRQNNKPKKKKLKNN